MLDVHHQAPEGFFQLVYQRCYLGPTRMWDQQPCDWQCNFFKFLQLAP
jgi:hypothetical protein